MPAPALASEPPPASSEITHVTARAEVRLRAQEHAVLCSAGRDWARESDDLRRSCPSRRDALALASRALERPASDREAVVVQRAAQAARGGRNQ